MVMLNPAIDNASQRLKDAVATFQAGRQTLFTESGQQRFMQDEHELRMGACFAALEREIGEILVVADAEERAAEATLTRLLGRMVVDQLTSEELNRATLMRPFVTEDAETLPIGEVVEKCRAATASEDRVLWYLWARAGNFRAGKIRERMAQDRRRVRAEERAGVHDLSQLVADLATRLATPGEKQEAEAQLAAAKKLRHDAYAARGEADGSLARGRQSANLISRRSLTA